MDRYGTSTRHGTSGDDRQRLIIRQGIRVHGAQRLILGHKDRLVRDIGMPGRAGHGMSLDCVHAAQLPTTNDKLPNQPGYYVDVFPHGRRHMQQLHPPQTPDGRGPQDNRLINQVFTNPQSQVAIEV